MNRERNLELISHNATEKQLREQAVVADKHRDKVLLNSALAQEQAVEQYEADERNFRREEIRTLQAHYQSMKSDVAQKEKLVDDLTQEENEK